jgi:hypothetical protein
MSDDKLTGVVWRKSSRSNGQSNCVELATNGRTWTAIRDSKQGERGPVLCFSAKAVRAFVSHVDA